MKFYRALLALYPERFRDEYGDELCRAFAERMRGRSWPVVIGAAIADVVPNAVAAQWDILRHGAAAGTTVPAFSGDVRFALRQIRRAPLLSGVVIAVIALGIGINAGLLTVLNTYAWRPAPGIPPDAALARLRPMTPREQGGGLTDVWVSYPDIRDLRKRRDVFADVAAWSSTRLPVDLAGGPENIMVSYTTANFFRTLHVMLAAGSGFSGDLDQSDTPVAVIGHSIWLTRFGGTLDVIGKTIRVMNVPFTIVGVAPERFSGIDVSHFGEPMIWVPLGARAALAPGAANDLTTRDAAVLRSVVRLAPGVRPGDVERLTSALAARFAREDSTHAGLSIPAERLTGIAEGKADRTELVAAFSLVVALVVVITCTNVSALLLGRAAARRREIGVRLALGATRRRLIRQMLTESLVYALAGTLLGLALYVPTIKIAYATMPEIVYGLEPQPATFLFAMLFAVTATIVFGLAPALHATSADIGEVMKNSGNHAIRRTRLQMIFVVVQLACSQPVLVVTSLVLADLRQGANDNADKAPATVVTMSSMIFRPNSAGGAGSVAGERNVIAGPDVLRAIRRRVMMIPGVQSAAISTGGSLPTRTFIQGQGVSFELPGQGAGSATGRLRPLYVTANYFATLGIPLRRGRTIGIGEDQAGSTAIVVNQAAVDLLWPREDPIGKRLVRRVTQGLDVTTSLEVIGVAGTAPYANEESVPMVFASLLTASSGWDATITVRTASDARTYVPPIRGAIREVEPYAAIANVITLAERYAGEQREAWLSNAAAFAVGAAALLLASLGLYVILAFAVVQRTRETGIRLAMGATSGVIVRQFFRNGVTVATIGLAIGLPLTVAGIYLVKASLLGFTVRSVATVTVVVPVLVVVAALASWLPARRAGRVDPMIALRSE